MPEEGYQCCLLSAGGAEYCTCGCGDVGDWVDGEYWARGAAECDWGWCNGTEGAEVGSVAFDVLDVS